MYVKPENSMKTEYYVSTDDSDESPPDDWEAAARGLSSIFQFILGLKIVELLTIFFVIVSAIQVF